LPGDRGFGILPAPTMRQLPLLVSLLLPISLIACGGGAGPDPGEDVDAGTDPDADDDGDGFTPATGDCDDHDDDVYPGAPEQDNDVDDDCDGIPDDDLPTVDDDGDGYSNVEGDCDDLEELVNPGSVEVNVTVNEAGEVVAEGVDNDCDGLVDEGNQTCDTALDGSNAEDYAHAVELCGDWIQGASFYTGTPEEQHSIKGRFGSANNPRAGAALAVLSTGLAKDASDPGFVPVVTGTEATGGLVRPHPLPQPDPADGCGTADPATVNDYISLVFTIKVPTNAQAIMYDFNFMSGEFPNFVCSSYDDTFLAILDSEDLDGNISFDDAGRPVTINIGFFDVCSPGQGPNCTGNAELAGTGFEVYGGTGWLHTIAPVKPGETITITFHLFDEGDRIYDSTVLIDNFQWLGVPVDGPVTVEKEVADEVHGLLMQGASVDEIRARF
jgi:hypothetical protein